MLDNILTPANEYAKTLIDSGYTLDDSDYIIKGLSKMPGVYPDYILDVIRYLGQKPSTMDEIEKKYK